MASVKRSNDGVTLNLTNDEVKNLTMVLSHVSTASVYDTFPILDALTDQDGMADLVRLFMERSTVKVGIVTPPEKVTWFDPNSIILLVRD